MRGLISHRAVRDSLPHVIETAGLISYTRVKTSRRPVDGFAAAEMSSGSARLSSNGTIDAAGFQDCAIAQQISCNQSIDALRNGCAARQEACSHTVRHPAQAQVEARRIWSGTN
jgi:hypothetical protein